MDIVRGKEQVYLTDKEYRIIKQALDDAENMQKKYEETLKYLEKHIDFLTGVIIKNNLCGIALESYNKQLKKGNNQHEPDIAKEEKEFRRAGTFGVTIKTVTETLNM